MVAAGMPAGGICGFVFSRVMVIGHVGCGVFFRGMAVGRMRVSTDRCRHIRRQTLQRQGGHKHGNEQGAQRIHGRQFKGIVLFSTICVGFSQF